MRTFCAEIFRNAPCSRSPPPTTRCPTLLPRRTRRFFLFYPARRRSDRWAINELKRPSFFLVSLWLSSSDALPPASPSPLHHPSHPSHNPHSRDEYSLSFSFPLPLIFPRSFSLPHTCTFSPSPSLPFFASVPLFPPFSAVLGPLYQHISFSPLSLCLLSVIVLLHLPPPPPAILVLFVPRLTHHSMVERNGLEAVLLTRFSILRSSVSLPSAYLTLPFPFSFSSSLSLFLSNTDWTFEPLRFPAGFSYTHTRSRTCISHAPARMQIPRFAFSHRQINLAGAYMWEIQRDDERGKKGERERERMREGVLKRGSWVHSGGACARVRRAPFVAHTRVSIFFPLASGTLVPFFCLPLPSLLSLPLFHPFHLFR